MLEVVLDLSGCCKVWARLIARVHVRGYCRRSRRGRLRHFAQRLEIGAVSLRCGELEAAKLRICASPPALLGFL